MMIELSNLIDYITNDFCYLACLSTHLFLDFPRRGMLFLVVVGHQQGHQPTCPHQLQRSRTHTLCVRANLPRNMTPLMLRRGRVRILRHRLGQKASPNASSCTPAAVPNGSGPVLEAIPSLQAWHEKQRLLFFAELFMRRRRWHCHEAARAETCCTRSTRPVRHFPRPHLVSIFATPCD